MPAAEPVAHRIAYHGEGPVWWPDGHLRIVDGYAGELVDLLADGTVRRTQVAGFAACMRPRVDGGAVVGTERGFTVLAPDATVHQTYDVLGPDRRMNDGGCDPDGNFWCGAMAWDSREGGGTLYRLDDAGDVTVALQDATVPNGLAWSADGSVAFWNDTPTGTVWQFDYAWDVGLVDRRPFARIDPADGAPDGLTVDRFGGVWVALWDGHAVRRYDPAGAVDVVVDVDARQVSSCAIGGDQLDRLYITTSREGLADDADPLAGSVFAYDLGQSAGVPVAAYGG